MNTINVLGYIEEVIEVTEVTESKGEFAKGIFWGILFSMIPWSILFYIIS